MAVDQIRSREEPAALDRSDNHLADFGRPGAAAKPSLRCKIAKVEMHPDEIRVARCHFGLSKITQRLHQPTAECEREQRTTAAETWHLDRGRTHRRRSASCIVTRRAAVIEPLQELRSKYLRDEPERVVGIVVVAAM